MDCYLVGELVELVSEGKECAGLEGGVEGERVGELMTEVVHSMADVAACSRDQMMRVAVCARRVEVDVCRLLTEEEAEAGIGPGDAEASGRAMLPDADRPRGREQASLTSVSFALQAVALALGVPPSIEAIVARGLDNAGGTPVCWTPRLSPARLAAVATVLARLATALSAAVADARAARVAGDAETVARLEVDWKERSTAHLERALASVQADAVGDAVRSLVQASYALGQRQLELHPRPTDPAEPQPLLPTSPRPSPATDVPEVRAVPTRHRPPAEPMSLVAHLPDPSLPSPPTSVPIPDEFAILPGLADFALSRQEVECEEFT